MAPGACHHVRWMAKIIYTLKLAIFQKQLLNHFDSTMFKKISSLSLFLCVFYVKFWLCSPYGVDAPKNDLLLLNELNFVITKSSVFPEYFFEFAVEGRMKLMDHLWYLSERLVPFCLFSDKTNTLEKQSVRKMLLKTVSDTTRSEMSSPFLTLTQQKLLITSYKILLGQTLGHF